MTDANLISIHDDPLFSSEHVAYGFWKGNSYIFPFHLCLGFFKLTL